MNDAACTARLSALVALALLAACDPGAMEEPTDETPREGIGALGYASHAIDSVLLVEVGNADHGLNGPRDLDFNPDVPGELWVVNQHDDSTVIYRNLDTDDETFEHLIDPFALHFMEEVSSISFATGMQFGTCQESRNTYNDQAPANDFMGPSLWSADPDVYAHTNPSAVESNGGYDLGSHLDMLHESPLCMGIAWERDNVYWTFDGLTSSVSRYDFRQDHGPGFDDHSDGVVERFTEAGVQRVEGVPSHLVVDHETQLLYVVDTGNARVLVVDTSRGGTPVAQLPASEPGVQVFEMTGVPFETLIDAEAGELVRPSGIALSGGVLYVSDNATSRITAFSTDGERLDWLDTGLPEGSLMGLRVDDEGRVWAVDYLGDRLLRFEAKE